MDRRIGDEVAAVLSFSNYKRTRQSPHMSEKIYLLNTDQKPEPLEETPFSG